jgi:MFS family permease
MDMKHKNTGILVAIGCFIIMFIHLGTLGTAGLFIPQFIRTLNVPVSQISLNVTFSSLTGFAFSILYGRFRNNVSARKMLLMGSIAGILHYLVAAVSNGIMLIYLGSILGGVTFGLGTHTCNAAIISQWFKEKRATVIGIVFSGAAFGSAVMMLISGILIDKIGWRSTYLIFAALHLFVAIPINIFLLKEVNVKILDNGNVKENKSIDFIKNESISDNLSMKDVHGSLSFWMLMLSMALCGTLIIGFKTFAPSFWQLNGVTALTSSKYISIFMVVATIATMISGTIADKFGTKIYIVYLHTAYLVGMSCVILFTKHLEIAYILIPVFLVAIAYPLYGSIPATVATEAFGLKNYDKVCGELMAAFFIGQATVSPIIGGLRDITGSYSAGFTIITIFGLISCILIVVAINISPAKKKMKVVEIVNQEDEELKSA